MFCLWDLAVALERRRGKSAEQHPKQHMNKISADLNGFNGYDARTLQNFFVAASSDLSVQFEVQSPLFFPPFDLHTQSRSER
jgi:hypothetical protein